MEWKDIYAYWLFKFNVYDNSYFFVRSGEFPPSGYCSLYAISAETMASLEDPSTSSYSGYKGTVWSPELVLDFDSFSEGEAARRRLIEMGLAFKMYESGGKGYHFYIPRPHAPSHRLPLIDKQWVAKVFPEADLSLYTHLHQLRVPGTIHDKTGKRKQLIESVDGEELLLADVQESLPESVSQKVTTNCDKSIFTNFYIQSLTVPVDEGDRHAVLMKLGLALRSLGEPLEFIHRYLYHTNLLFSTPKPADELERLVRFLGEADV